MKSLIFLLAAFCPLNTIASYFKCPSPAGYFKHTNCLKFWQCANGAAFEMNCAPGTQWDQSLLTCNYLTTCGQKPQDLEPTEEWSSETTEASSESTSSFICPSENGNYSKNDCQNFWQCTNWVSREMACSPGTQWDQESLSCNRLAICMFSQVIYS